MGCSQEKVIYDLDQGRKAILYTLERLAVAGYLTYSQEILRTMLEDLSYGAPEKVLAAYKPTDDLSDEENRILRRWKKCPLSLRDLIAEYILVEGRKGSGEINTVADNASHSQG